MPEETTVTTTSTSDGDVLAEAAVAAAAVSGAAIVTAQDAATTAEEASTKAEEASTKAEAASATAAGSVSAEEARIIARQESDRYISELAEWQAALDLEAQSSNSSEPLDDDVPDEVLPPSVKKAGGASNGGEKIRFSDRWNGRP